MKRLHIAVCTQLGNGHVYPVLPVCAELVQRGHRVTYAVNSHYERVVREVGCEPVLFRNPPISKETEETIRVGFALPLSDPRSRAAITAFREYFFEDALAMLSQVKAFYQSNAPDMVLYDRYFVAGRILAKQFDVAAVQLSGHFAYYNNLALRENGVCRNPDALLEWSKELDTFLGTQGVNSKGSYWHVEDLNIHVIPKEFQYHSDSFDERYCFVGALVDRPFRRVWSDRSGGIPIVLISGLSGLQHMSLDYTDYYRVLIEAFSGSGCHCVLSLCNGDDVADLPENVEVARNVSHLEILPHVSLLVSHGGMGTTLEAAYHGVPSLMIPLGASCAEVAYRAVELGLGQSLALDGVTRASIAETASAMMADSSLRERVEAMRQVFGRSGGARLAADRIEAAFV